MQISSVRRYNGLSVLIAIGLAGLLAAAPVLSLTPKSRATKLPRARTAATVVLATARYNCK